MDLPSTFPVFPLNQVILVPGQLLPLHIFESRYRAMVNDAMAGNRMLAMAFVEEDATGGVNNKPKLSPVCGLGRIVHHQQYPDGRGDIILEGLARMEIEEELECDTLYRQVRGTRFAEFEPAEDVMPRARMLLHRVQCFDAEECDAYSSMPLSRLIDTLLLRIPVPIQIKRDIYVNPRLSERLVALERAMDQIEKPPSSIAFEPEDPRLN